MNNGNKILFGALVIVFIVALTFFLAKKVEKQPEKPSIQEEMPTKQEIMQLLSAPGPSALTEQQRDSILQSLSAPQQ